MRRFTGSGTDAPVAPLADLHDTPLPKLMSGELRVPEAAEMADGNMPEITAV